MKRFILIALSLAAVAGCSSYTWRSSVPEEMRTVYVPTFRNETEVVELGALATRQTLREFQREGTFKIASADDAALEVQVVLKSAPVGMLNFKRSQSMRAFLIVTFSQSLTRNAIASPRIFSSAPFAS